MTDWEAVANVINFAYVQKVEFTSFNNKLSSANRLRYRTAASLRLLSPPSLPR
jgi:hypothetical protein